MAKCIDCAWFPWIPGADFSNLPVMRCHPDLKAHRWPGNAAIVKHECPKFKPKEAIQAEVEAGTDAKAEDKTAVNPGDMTVQELKQYLETVEDSEEVQRLLDAELASKDPRKTAIEALEDKLEELKAGENNDANGGTKN